MGNYYMVKGPESKSSIKVLIIQGKVLIEFFNKNPSEATKSKPRTKEMPINK